MKLIKDIEKLRTTEIKNVIDSRLSDFKKVHESDNNRWFSELCFCLLTANSKAQTAINIQEELKEDGFINASEDEVRNCIIKNKHRFHNNKAKYIVGARHFINIKDIIQPMEEIEAREWLVKNIKGLGYKEASHFMRNIGYENLAILDRHIINMMVEHGLLNEKPKSLNKNMYLQIEDKFKSLSEKVNMNLDELDFYVWYLKTNKVLK